MAIGRLKECGQEKKKILNFADDITIARDINRSTLKLYENAFSSKTKFSKIQAL